MCRRSLTFRLCAPTQTGYDRGISADWITMTLGPHDKQMDYNPTNLRGILTREKTMKINCCIAAILFATLTLNAQQVTPPPFSEFEKQLQIEPAGFNGNKERLSKV